MTLGNNKQHGPLWLRAASRMVPEFGARCRGRRCTATNSMRTAVADLKFSELAKAQAIWRNVGAPVPASSVQMVQTGASYVVVVFWPVGCGDPCRLTVIVTGPSQRNRNRCVGQVASEEATDQPIFLHRPFCAPSAIRQPSRNEEALGLTCGNFSGGK